MLSFSSLAILFSSAALVTAGNHDSLATHDLSKRCTGTIKSFNDVAAAVKCTTVNIYAMTVPVGKTLQMDFLKGTTVNVLGDITFGTGQDWAGPMVIISGDNVIFNGNNHKWNFHGEYWWDTKGSNGGRTKPRPAFKVKTTGQFNDVYLKNTPVQAFSVANKAKLVIHGATVDNVDGAVGEKGHNTDGFDVSGSTDLTIEKSVVKNQDDCIAINDAKNLTFKYNVCQGGHGASIGSIKSDKNVKGVIFKGNQIKDSTNGVRIKTYVGAKSASVADVTYDGNVLTNISKYGVIIQQDYTNEGATGKPSNDVPISNIKFSGDMTTIAVGSKAKQVYILCGSSSCKGTWDFSKLSSSGGSRGSITGAKVSGWKL